MQLPGQRQDQRHGVLRHRLRIHALRARQTDAGGLERVARVLVGAGADRLNESEPWRLLNELVAPQHGRRSRADVLEKNFWPPGEKHRPRVLWLVAWRRP